jgi:putative tryptophan/tyrosine transport system substrate-binding protein
MRRTTVGLFVMLALSALAAPVVAAAQQPTKVYRVGRLSRGSSSLDPNIEAFRQGLRDLGYVEGHNVLLELRYAEGNEARLRQLAAELVHLPVDVIVASSAPAARR